VQLWRTAPFRALPGTILPRRRATVNANTTKRFGRSIDPRPIPRDHLRQRPRWVIMGPCASVEISATRPPPSHLSTRAKHNTRPAQSLAYNRSSKQVVHRFQRPQATTSDERVTMTLRTRILPGILFFVLTAGLPLAAAAQAPGEAHVHIHQTRKPQQVTTTTGDVGLSISEVFSLLNADNQLLTTSAPEIQDATISIDGDNYKADVQELNEPWTIVFLLDASKTISTFNAASDYKTARLALADAATGVPDNTNMALLSFANTSPTVVPFTQKKETVSTAITNVRAQGSGNSCLYDGVYQAVNMLSSAPGSKAVVVLTASQDDCADRTPNDIVNLALQNQVQIYAVGIQGYTVTKQDLTALTDPTGGLAEIRDQNNLRFGMSNIVGIFKNQWTAKATVYPTAGEKTGSLTVNLKDGTSLKSEDFTFTSTQDYIPPAQIRLKGKVQSTANGIEFNLDIVQAEKIRQLNVTIVSKDTGESVLAQALTTFSDVNSLPAQSLSPGLDYTLNVAAVDNSGKILSQDTADFKYEPPPAALKVSGVQPPAPGQDKLQVTVTATNLSGTVKYKAWLIEPQNNTKMTGTEVTVPLGDPILIPTDSLKSGAYAVVVQALDSSDTILAESQPFQLTFKQPTMFEKFRLWVSSSPFAIAGLTGVCCLALLGVIALVWIMVPKNRDQAIAVDLVMPERGRRQAAPKPGIQVPPRAPDHGARQAPAAPRAPEPPVAPAAPAGPAARLTLRFPVEPGWSMEMRRSPVKVGRRKDNEAALPVDSSSGVSGHHVTITYERGTYFVLDDSSKFGTSINGKAIVKGEPTQLTDGDLIGLGPIVKVVFNIL
jgi:hypothetical protein